MIDLVVTASVEGPATLFTRNFRVHSGIPIGLYETGPRAPVVLIYGDITPELMEHYSEQYQGIITMPSVREHEIPESPDHYETMTVKAPILARVGGKVPDGYGVAVTTAEGTPLLTEGMTRNVPTLGFTADLIKATILILSGALEQSTGRDRYGRHNPPPDRVITAPVVSFHFNLIEHAVRAIYRKLGLPLLSIPRWPDSAPLAMFISHDIDVVKKWTWKRTAYEIVSSLGDLLRFRGQRMAGTVESLLEAMRNHDPYWNFDDLLFFESGAGFQATWFFAPFGGDYQKRLNSYDPVYHRKSAEITAMIRKIMEKGGEVALHGTRNAFLDEEELKRQIESFERRLGFRIRGVRHHYLMFRHGSTLEAAAAAGLGYDTTLGLTDRTGYRNGIATPFFPFPRTHATGGALEIPLNFMDTMFQNNVEQGETNRRRVIEAYLYAKAAGGMFSMLIHPGNMDPAEAPDLGSFYRSFLPRCRLDDACGMTGAEISDWWHAREQVLRSVEYLPGIWRIRGVPIPDRMDFAITVPGITSMKFAIEGARGSSTLNHDTLSIRPGAIDPDQGITIARKG